jgi:dTDP-4-amino-4,6-dideoxygalactose transaminase
MEEESTPVASSQTTTPSIINEKIPLVDLQANLETIRPEIDEAITQLIDTCYFVGSPKVKQFEEEFANFIGTKHCIGVNSGTDALILALKMLDIGPGDEVITQGNTFVATCLGISNNGAKVVLCDIDPLTHLIDPSKIEALITSKTKAIIPVHLYGQCCDMESIMDIAKRHGLKVVEDTAQAHGSMYNEKMAGSIGDAGCFSFYPGKNLGAFGDGGAICTNNSEIARRLVEWRSWGAKQKYVHDIKGGNSRLDSIQAVVLSVKLKYLNQWNNQRRNASNEYIQRLTLLSKEWPNDVNLILPKCTGNDPLRHVWHLFVIQVNQRDELLTFLHENNIGAGMLLTIVYSHCYRIITFSPVILWG